MHIVLKQSITDEDFEFISGLDADTSLISVNTVDNDTDGWRDAATGALILMPYHRVVFNNPSPALVTMLTLRFGDRLLVVKNKDTPEAGVFAVKIETMMKEAFDNMNLE